jgi:aminoglycoside phosphotransferase (APT) family kinase protein
VLTHGELYPAHVLTEGDARIVGVLDWTTAKVGDPAADFALHHMIAGASFELAVRAYEEAGGRPLPRLEERCAAILAAGPVGYGVFALTTGRPEHREAAAAQLSPAPS